MIFVRLAVQQVGNLALLMAICLFLPGRMVAQQSRTPPPNTVPASGGLRILVLEGQSAVNNVRAPATMVLVVEVRDENDRPVEGATVDFQVPLMGPSGSFEGGVRNKQVITNVQGQASAPFTPNSERGRFTVQVKATTGPRSAVADITQRNSTQAEPVQNTGWIARHKKLVILVAAVAAGAAVAAILATRSASSLTPNAPTLTITPGVPTVGGSQ